jgi:mannose-6-phosphate isomerase-like protein (cupin superfamily)
MERIRVGHDDITIHVDSEESGGALLAVEVRMPPGGGPPAMHRHPSAEVYRVERGELAIYREDERIPAPAGTTS